MASISAPAPARWTGLAPSTRILEQIHPIVTGPRNEPTQRERLIRRARTCRTPLPLGRDARRAANRLVLGMKGLAYVLCRRASFSWHGILLNWLSEIGATVARQPRNDGHL